MYECKGSAIFIVNNNSKTVMQFFPHEILCHKIQLNTGMNSHAIRTHCNQQNALQATWMHCSNRMYRNQHLHNSNRMHCSNIYTTATHIQCCCCFWLSSKPVQVWWSTCFTFISFHSLVVESLLNWIESTEPKYVM